MNTQRSSCPYLFGLILALVGLVIGMALPLVSTNVAASVKQLDFGSISSAHAQENPQILNRWNSNGPDGAFIRSLAIDPLNPATIYAGTEQQGIFKSTDNGGSWSSCLANGSFFSLAIDPRMPTTVYAAGGGGVTKSIDGGASWNAINNGLARNENGAVNSVITLAINPTYPNIIYAGVSLEGVFNSTNGGASWRQISSGFTSVNALAIDPVHPNIIYQGNSGEPSFFKSTNSGATWRASDGGLPRGSDAYVDVLAIDPTNPNIIYAGTIRGVFKSTDGAISWTAFNDGLTNPFISALAIEPGNPTIVYVGTASGVFKSTNGGGSWGLINSGLTNTRIWAVAIDPINTGTAYAGTFGVGVFKSTSGGATWRAANQGLLHRLIARELAPSPASVNMIYTETDGGPYKSADSGGSWSPSDFYPLAFDPRNPNTIYATQVAGRYGLSKSTNGGATWTSANTGLENTGVSSVAIDPSNSEVIYAATGGGVFKSTNGGESWIQSSTVPDGISTLAIDPRNSNIIYAGGSGVFKSTDAGGTWSAIGNFYYVGLLVIDPGNSQTLYAVAYDGYLERNFVSKSTDGGANWSAVLSYDVSSLVIDPLHPNVIYVGTYGDGVFNSADGGTNWNPLNGGLTNLNVYALAIDASGNFLHAGTPSGVFDYQVAIPCTYSTSSASQSFPSGGGIGNVNVTTPSVCNWQATSTVSWVTISSGSGGSGDGVVNFSVMANAEPFPRTATLSIAGRNFTVNQFGIPPINPNDDTGSFVRQHYLDFLSREPDAAGLDFWTRSITDCGFDRECFEVKRINNSAAFFLSIEFQQTGYLVYRTYKAAYGNMPATPVPLRLSEFLPDTQEIGQGVIVNQPGWEQLLENNKQAFFAELVQRSRFTSAYPTSLTPATFVDMLFANAGVVSSAIDRQAAISEFVSTSNTVDAAARARALRRVAENSILAQQEFNRAFVLMQYFGYLRRNPNDPPEAALNFDGYNFWLTKLNQFNGNFVQAEMVKSFLVSSEYRQRFGQP